MTSTDEEKETPKRDVTLTKEAFNKRNIFVARTDIVEVPELNPLMDLKPPQVATVEVSQLDLTGFLQMRADITNQMRNVIEGVMSAAVSKEQVKDEVLKEWDKMGPDEKYRIAVVEAGLIEPKLNRSDIIFISKLFPAVLMRIAEKILALTSQGGNLKKNLTG